MGDETLLVALLGGLHLLGFGFAAVLLLPLLRDERIAPLAHRGEDEDDGGGGNDRVGPAPPRGPRGGRDPRCPTPSPRACACASPCGSPTCCPARGRREHAPAPTPARTPVRGRVRGRRAARHVLAHLRLPVGERGEGRLLRPVEPHEALLVQRRRAPRVAAAPERPHAELLQRPVDAAREPRLRREHAEVEAHEVVLELVGALLLQRPVAVRLGAVLGHGDRLAAGSSGAGRRGSSTSWSRSAMLPPKPVYQPK